MTDKEAVERLEQIAADMHDAVAGGMAWISHSECNEFTRRIREVAEALTPTEQTDDSLTLDNASAQRLMDYGLLHRTDEGWTVGTWDDAVAATATEQTDDAVVERASFGKFQHWFFQRLKPEQRHGLLDALGYPKLYGLELQFKAVRQIFAAIAALPTEQMAKDDVVEAAIETLQNVKGFLEGAPLSSGVCCCGEDMERHSDPMSCGHSPVDSGHYAMQKRADLISATLVRIGATERKDDR